MPDLNPIWQGDFAVYHPWGEPFTPYPGNELRLPSGIPSRARVQWVEIVYQMDGIDYAQVHFIDPHQEVQGWVAEQLVQGGEVKYTPWVAQVGYRDPVPGLPKQRCEIGGYPQIERTSFPDSGDPEVTIVLTQPTDFLKHGRTIPKGHWYYWTQDPHPLKQSIKAIAEKHGLGGPVFGKLEQTINEIEELLYNYWKENPDAQWKEGDLQFAIQDFVDNKILAPPFEGWMAPATDQPVTDWDYLNALKNVVWSWFCGHSSPTPPLGITDTYFSAVYSNNDKAVVKVKDGVLYFACQSDLYDDLNDLTIFEYRCGARNIISADFQMVQNQRQGVLAAFGDWVKRMFNADLSEVPVIGGLFQSPESDTTTQEWSQSSADAQLIRSAASKDRRYPNQVPVVTKNWALGTIKWLLGHLASNITVTVKVLGAPHIHAGSLVGLVGFKPGPETMPDPGGQRVNHYERIYVASKVTHRVDQTGLYVTTMTLVGASSDNSPQKLLEQAATQEGSSGSLVSQLFSGF